MNICLIGYGRMGQEIEKIALKRGHIVKLIVDHDNTTDLNSINLRDVDVAIEFSSPDAAYRNIVTCLALKVPVVSGTTGWMKDLDKAGEVCLKNGTSFIHSSNFSIGVNLLYRLNKELAGHMKHFREYSVSIEEIHHTQKLDAPSGTAIALAEGIRNRNPEYRGWCSENDHGINCIQIRSVREGNVPGTHTIAWDSDIDTIILKHVAKNRKGFALGAVVAAEFISTRKGVFTMSDVLGF